MDIVEKITEKIDEYIKENYKSPSLMFISPENYTKLSKANFWYDKRFKNQYLFGCKIMITNSVGDDIVVCDEKDRQRGICNYYTNNEYITYIKNNIKTNVDANPAYDTIEVVSKLKIPSVTYRIEYEINDGVDINDYYISDDLVDEDIEYKNQGTIDFAINGFFTFTTLSKDAINAIDDVMDRKFNSDEERLEYFANKYNVDGFLRTIKKCEKQGYIESDVVGVRKDNCEEEVIGTKKEYIKGFVLKYDVSKSGCSTLRIPLLE